MNSRVKNLIFWVVVGLFMILLFNLFTFQGQSPDEEVKFSEFVSRVEQGDVREVTIRGNYINGLFKDGRPFRTYMSSTPIWSRCSGTTTSRSTPSRRKTTRGT